MAVDEGTLEENPDYLPDQCDDQLAQCGGDVESSAVVDIEINGVELDRLLMVQTLKGKVSEPD